jgi:AraC-like DNA-binding protein
MWPMPNKAAVPPLPAPRRALIPIAFVRAILLAYRKYGVHSEAALATAHIRLDALEDLNGRVTAAQFESLAWVAMRELDDEALGWFTRKLPWGAYGMLCRASLTAATLEIALKRWSRHHRILTNDVLLHLSVADGVASLSIEERRDLGDFREFCLVTLLRYMLGFACWAIDRKIVVSSAAFPFPAPPHSAVYAKLFSKTLNFCAPRACIAFDARYLSMPLQRDESAINKMLKHALPLTVLPYRRDELLAGRVDEVLRMPGAKYPVAGDLAEVLNVSTRTLHRRLQQEGASLRRLKESARMDHAKQILAGTPHSIKRVAFTIGYRNEKSFSRAFRHWTGETPSAFRSRVARERDAVEQTGAHARPDRTETAASRPTTAKSSTGSWTSEP